MSTMFIFWGDHKSTFSWVMFKASTELRGYRGLNSKLQRVSRIKIDCFIFSQIDSWNRANDDTNHNQLETSSCTRMCAAMRRSTAASDAHNLRRSSTLHLFFAGMHLLTSFTDFCIGEHVLFCLRTRTWSMTKAKIDLLLLELRWWQNLPHSETTLPYSSLVSFKLRESAC